ncbi:hypothetical protein I302_103105 [Kwoniella bestiolae CBS 10118]|uniref:CRIB domain-containing protein n=1 Tax=Kwoniella bestiolae CBS 10118 TaxID=1296100 RepID=A0AAJ8K560_9TREE
MTTFTTSRPTPPPLIHSGYNDLVSLVASTPSKLGVNLASNPQSSKYNSPSPLLRGYPRLPDPLPRADSYVRLIQEEVTTRPFLPSSSSVARGGRARGYARGGGRVGAGNGREEWKVSELKKRKIDKKMIGYPTDFRHIFHASTFEEATELLLRWSIEGVGDKLGDPAWAYPIKELVKARAREQQARAVAAVVEATARTRDLANTDMEDLKAPGTLRVVNGLPSSIYSTTNTLLKSNNKARPTILTRTSGINAYNSRSTGKTSISPLLTGGSTPIAIANFQGYFDDASSTGHRVVRTPTSPLNHPIPFASPDLAKGNTKPLQIKKKSISALPTPIEASPTTKSEEAVIEDYPPLPSIEEKPSSPPTPSRRKDARPKAQEIFTTLPFRIIKPSLETLEKSMSIALYFEQYYHSLLKTPLVNVVGYSPPRAHSDDSKPVHPGNYVLNRARRLAKLESTFALPENRFMSDDEKMARREELQKEENRILRERRKKVDVKGFELGRVIGHGAFGVVRIARERESGRLVAMKQVSGGYLAASMRDCNGWHGSS